MKPDRKEPEREERLRAHRRRGLFRRLRRWWDGSRIARQWRILTGRLYFWWFPPAKDPYSYGGYYSYGRHNRLVRAWRRLKRRIRGSSLATRCRVLLYRLHDWWFPPAKEPYAYYGYYGRDRGNRLTRAWYRLRRRINGSAPARGLRLWLGRLYEWWYPPSAGGYSYYGYYGRGRLSRPARAWHRFKRSVRDSWIGRRCLLLTGRLYLWWYPYDYHGGGRRSRPAKAWHRFKHSVRDSWIGQRCLLLAGRFYLWWYPPPDISGGYYPHHRLESRPVRAVRRWLRWFRGTWLGRKMGWVLDDIADLLYFTRRRLAKDFAWRRVRLWLLRWQTAVLLGCLLGATGFGYKYGVPRYHRFLEERYGRQAERFLAKGDFARAMLRARQVLQFNVENPVATRVIADVADRFSAPFAMYWRQRTVLLAPDVTNRLALAATAIRAEAFPFPIAVKALQEIEPEARQTLTYLLVAGALAVKLNNLEEAEQHYAEAVKLAPDNPASRMSLAVVRLQSKNPKVIADSRTTLELLRTDRQLGLLALRSLVAESVGRRDFERAENLSNQVLTNTQSSFSDRILHLAILNGARRTNFQTFLAETEQQAQVDFFRVGELAAWMNTYGYARQALAWLLDLPPAVTSQGLVPINIADSYVALGKWKELETYLENERWLGLDHVRFALLTLAVSKQSGGKRSSPVWERAIRVASRSPGALSLLSQLAVTWGWKEEAEDVLWYAAGKYPDQAWPLMALQNFHAARRDTAGLRHVARAVLAKDPNDRTARNNYAMLSLLLRVDMTKAHQYAEELHAAEPENPVYASTCAFSLHLQGRTKEALQVLRDLGLEQLDNPALAVYYGVILAAAGDAQAAKHYLSKSAQAFLLPEEAAMVEQAKKRL